MLSFQQARERVIEVVAARAGARRAAPGDPWPPQQRVPLADALGRVLAEEVRADRDYPPFDRSTRDGFALRAADLAALPATLELAGEVRAGEMFRGSVPPGQCVQIMTGAPVPAPLDAVVMLEHTRAEGKRVTFDRPAQRGQNIVPRGSEARAGQALLHPGARLGYAELAAAAQAGRTELSAYRRPRLAILSTGDEVVPVESAPGPAQIRNSNSAALAAQAVLAGAEPVPLGNAPDHCDALRAAIERGLREDALALTGGVSMGKYDLVEGVLREMGAEFFFDAVAIRPGKPAVFAMCRGTPVFGLPGNPVSTMVTFELFAVPALDILGGAPPRPLAAFKARLEAAVSRTAALTHFVPAEVVWTSGEAGVRELPWQGSGDIVALSRANAYLIVPAGRLELAAGEWVDVLPRRGML